MFYFIKLFLIYFNYLIFCNFKLFKIDSANEVTLYILYTKFFYKRFLEIISNILFRNSLKTIKLNFMHFPNCKIPTSGWHFLYYFIMRHKE